MFYLKYNFRKCMHHCLQINKLRNFPDLKLIGNVFPLQRTLDMGFINLNLQNPTKGELLRTRKIGLTWPFVQSISLNLNPLFCRMKFIEFDHCHKTQSSTHTMGEFISMYTLPRAVLVGRLSHIIRLML